MGLLETILIIVILVVLVIVIWNVFFKKNTMLMNGIHQASPGVEISHTKLPENNSSNYSFALWFFIEDWDSNYGNVKNVIYMGPSKTTVAMTGSNLGASGNQGPALNPSGNNIAAALDAYENNLLIGVKTFASANSDSAQRNMSMLPSSNYFSEQSIPGQSKHSYETFKITNVNVQKWVCLIVCVCGRNLDIYLHGKLVRSFILPGVAVGVGRDNVYIGGSSSDTFKGHVARFQFFDKCLNPQQAYNIYREGLGSDLFGDFFNKYRMKIQFFEYNHALGKPIVL